MENVYLIYPSFKEDSEFESPEFSTKKSAEKYGDENFGRYCYSIEDVIPHRDLISK